MTTLNLTATLPGQVISYGQPNYGVATIPSYDGGEIYWDIVPNAVSYEVWGSVYPNIDTASLIATTTTNHYYIAGLSVNHYLWVRAFDKYNISGLYSYVANNDPTRVNIGYEGINVTNPVGIGYISLYVYNDGTTTETIDLQYCSFNIHTNTIPATTVTSTGWLDFNGTYGTGASSKAVPYPMSGISSTTAIPWTTPNNISADDASYASVTLAPGEMSELLVVAPHEVLFYGPYYDKIVGIEYKVKGKSNNVLNSYMYAYMSDFYGNNIIAPNGYNIYSQPFLIDNVEGSVIFGGATDQWGLNKAAGTLLTLQNIIPSRTAQTTMTQDTGAETASSHTTTLATVTNYGTWYQCSHRNALSYADALITINEHILSTISSTSVTGSQVLNIYIRARYESFAGSLAIPGATKKFLIYSQTATKTYGSASNIFNYSELIRAGQGGLITLYNGNNGVGSSAAGSPSGIFVWFEIMKEQTVGTPTATVVVDSAYGDVSVMVIT